MPWGAAAAIGGALISANAAGDAADTQAGATAAANAESARQFDRNVELQMPTINAGNTARNMLLYRLGLSPSGTSGAGATTGAGSTGQTRDQVRNELLAQYTRAPSAGTAAPATVDPYASALTQESRWALAERDQAQGIYTAPAAAPASTVDEEGLNAAIEARLLQQSQAQQQAVQTAQSDPNYGDLAQNFQFDKYQAATPYVADKFSYTGEDLYNDPSYQFRLQQGQKAIDRQGAASGRFLSGAQLQASSNYNQGAASQEFQNAYQRALGTFGTNSTNKLNAYNTNETNRFNAFNTNETNRFNASQANFTNAVNPLLSLAGSATLGAQNLGQAGMQTAQIMGNNLTNQANATGAAGIASANSISNGLMGAVNGYNQNQQATQQNQLLQTYLRGNGGVNNNPGASGYPSGYFTGQYEADR